MRTFQNIYHINKHMSRADSTFLSFQQMMEFHDLLAENNMTLVTSVVVTDTTVDFKSLIARLVVSS